MHQEGIRSEMNVNIYIDTYLNSLSDCIDCQQLLEVSDHALCHAGLVLSSQWHIQQILGGVRSKRRTQAQGELRHMTIEENALSAVSVPGWPRKR